MSSKDEMKQCSVCESGNLNDFECDAAGGHYPIWWCEDCGSLHLGSNSGEDIRTWQPEEIQKVDVLLWDVLADVEDAEHQIEMHRDTLPQFTRRLVEHLRKIKAVGEKRRDGKYPSLPETLRDQVLAFHKKFGQPIGDKPHVPDPKLVRFRLALITEEYLELLEAALGPHESSMSLQEVGDRLCELTQKLPIDVKLVDFIDATHDLDYVIEGTRVVMGVDGAPIAAEVHRANMAKEPTYVAAKDATHGNGCKQCGKPVAYPGAVYCGAACTARAEAHEPPTTSATIKPTKPTGWKPPDILGELRKQGWGG